MPRKLAERTRPPRPSKMAPMRIALLLVLALGGACRRATPPPTSAPVGNVGSGSASAASGSAAEGSGSGSAAACFDACMAARQMQAMGIDQIRAGCQAECEPQPVPDGP